MGFEDQLFCFKKKLSEIADYSNIFKKRHFFKERCRFFYDSITKMLIFVVIYKMKIYESIKLG